MVINKKRQPCSGIIQNMITFRRRKTKKKPTQDLGHTCINTHTNMNSVYLVSEEGMCSNFNNTC